MRNQPPCSNTFTTLKRDDRQNEKKNTSPLSKNILTYIERMRVELNIKNNDHRKKNY